MFPFLAKVDIVKVLLSQLVLSLFNNPLKLPELLVVIFFENEIPLGEITSLIKLPEPLLDQ